MHLVTDVIHFPLNTLALHINNTGLSSIQIHGTNLKIASLKDVFGCLFVGVYFT